MLLAVWLENPQKKRVPPMNVLQIVHSAPNGFLTPFYVVLIAPRHYLIAAERKSLNCMMSVVF